MLAIGLMSGTSLDGVDAALVEIEPRGSGYAVELLDFQTHPLPMELREALMDVLPPSSGTTEKIAKLHRALGHVFAQAARATARSEAIAFVASHGQTVWHDGDARVTMQIGDPFVIREELRVTVCYDFRSADCAAGGQGAPLVARIDALLLSSDDEDRVALNVGGIANVTVLRKGAHPDEALAFDTGPGNMLLDAFVRERTRDDCEFDRDGAFAAAGRADASLLRAILADGYFDALAPKTTGRERFGTQFLAQHREELRRLSLEDGAATLTEVTAVSIAQAVTRAGVPGARVVVSGGGARNATLLARLAARLPSARVETSDAMGIPAEAKEAMAFATLGYETLRGRPGNVPAATGARGPVVLGAIAPCNLDALLSHVDRECRQSSP